MIRRIEHFNFSALADEGAAPTQSGDGATNGRTPDHEGTMSGFGRCETFDHDRRHRRSRRLIWRGAAAAKGVAASIFPTPRRVGCGKPRPAWFFVERGQGRAA